MNPIFVDNREPVDITQGFKEPVTKVHLTSGDFMFTGVNGEVVGIERKGVGDLVNSFKTGRLQTQLVGLVGTYTEAILLLEGWRGIDRRGFIRSNRRTYHLPWTMLENFLMSAQRGGVLIHHSPSKKETPKLVVSLRNYYSKETHTSMVARPRRSVVSIADFDKHIEFLTGIPGVGPKTAESMLKEFGSIWRAMNAKPDTLVNCEGVGMKRADEIYKFLTGKWQPNVVLPHGV